MNPRTEIVTMNREGLAAFMRELKRVKLRHHHADALAEVPESKLDKALDILIAAWEREQAETVEKHRHPEEGEGTDKDAMMRALQAQMRDASANLMALRFASIEFYLGKLNRDINKGRVEAYRADMAAGRWWFTPDPVVVTDTGDIINGQHRLLAVERAELKEGVATPSFIVVWGVDKKAAILMDEARRTSTDRRDIALRYAGSR